MKIFTLELNPICLVLGVMDDDNEHILSTAAFTNQEDLDAAENLTATLLARLNLLEASESPAPAPTLSELFALIGLDANNFTLEWSKK